MAFVFQIKRRLAGDAGPPCELESGELAFNEVDNTLYIGVAAPSGTEVPSCSAVPVV